MEWPRWIPMTLEEPSRKNEVAASAALPMMYGFTVLFL